MDGFDSMVAEIKAEFVERKVMARLVDNHIQDQILIFIRKDFLDMFRAQDGVAVADELLSPSWGKYLDDNLEGLPAWMADVKYKTVNKDRRAESIEEVDRGFAYQERRIKN